MTSATRGRVYRVDMGKVGLKPFLVVSNNRRNRSLPSMLAVRVTTSEKPPLASIVELAEEDPLAGRVLCDEITEVWSDEIRADLGAVTPTTMRRVEDGLRAALAL